MSKSYPPPLKFPQSRLMEKYGSTLVLVLLALLMLVFASIFTVRLQSVSGTEVGVKVNNVTGDITVISDSGTHIYNGLLSSFHLLDTTVQRLEMTADASRGDRPTQDDLRIKTVDGSDVYLDTTINYQIRRDRVKEVITTSGLGGLYKVKWVRDYSRSVCRNVFGEMTTEEFYDASIRNDKAQRAEDELNRLFKPFGIEVTKVIAEKFRFHQEYEEKIRAKKLADQEVEEQISKANAAKQKQIFRTVEANKKKDVLLAEVEGRMTQLVVQANANADKATKEAEAYAIKTRLGADAEFYKRQQNAQAIIATTQATAEATKARATALEGEGGVNIVKLAYAQKLRGMSVTGQPYTLDSDTKRIKYLDDGAERSPKK